MKHIHGQKIIHRDLKSQNVFLMKCDDSIRLGDFGVSKILEFTDAKASTFIGTPFYMSPEVFSNIEYTSKTDIWSLGILFYYICALEMPIKAINIQELYAKVVNFKRVPALPKQYSNDIKELIDSMLQFDQSKRPTIEELLDHKAIKLRIARLTNHEKLSSINQHKEDVVLPKRQKKPPLTKRPLHKPQLRKQTASVLRSSWQSKASTDTLYRP